MELPQSAYPQPDKTTASPANSLENEKVNDSGPSSDTASSDAVEKSVSDVEDDGEMSTARVLVVWSAIALSNLCVFLDEGIIATAIPQITDQFHSLADVGVSLVSVSAMESFNT